MKKKNLKIIFGFIIIIIIVLIVIFRITYTTVDDIKSSTNPNSAYVINLNKRPERWENIQKSFENSSIELIRLPAVEHEKGHIGCGLSFMKAVKYAKKHNMKTILIFEDDNKPLEGFDKRWQIIKNWLDNNLEKWEIFNGGARFPDWGKYETQTISAYSDKVHLKYSIDDKEYLFQSEQLLSTNWIYINSSVYDKVLKWGSDIFIDRYLLDTKYFNHIFCIPHLALQENGESDTDNKLINYKKNDENLISIFDDVYLKEIINI